jgi:hypothetical protein
LRTMKFKDFGVPRMTVDPYTVAEPGLDPSGVQQGWRASLSLSYSQAGARTLLSHQHSGPLRVQRPFFPEGGVNHTYVLHPPGGMVGDDVPQKRIAISVHNHN